MKAHELLRPETKFKSFHVKGARCFGLVPT